jgi:hypothetical protein
MGGTFASPARNEGLNMQDELQYPDALIVPPPPDGDLWDDNLRWCVFVMNKGDPQRHFAASCLAWVMKTGGLSDKQAAACGKMLDRILGLYGADALDCQGSDPMSELSNMMARRGMN